MYGTPNECRSKGILVHADSSTGVCTIYTIVSMMMNRQPAIGGGEAAAYKW